MMINQMMDERDDSYTETQDRFADGFDAFKEIGRRSTVIGPKQDPFVPNLQEHPDTEPSHTYTESKGVDRAESSYEDKESSPSQESSVIHDRVYRPRKPNFDGDSEERDVYAARNKFSPPSVSSMSRRSSVNMGNNPAMRLPQQSFVRRQIKDYQQNSRPIDSKREKIIKNMKKRIG